MGVTDSKGTAYDFDQYGLHVSTAGWKQCVAINIVNKIQHSHATLSNECTSEWDDKLQCWALEPNWTSVR